jgi:transposase
MSAEPRLAGFRWYVGIDWGNAAHHVSVGDATGAAVGERVFAHTAAGLAEMVIWLVALTQGQLALLAVAIETPRGALVETLLAQGVAVFTLNPKQTDRFRDRFNVAGAKDDDLDARVLRSALHTDGHCFRRVAPEAPEVLQLRELARADADLAEEFTRLTNRVREQVHRLAPEWLTLSPNADDPWFWALLAYAPTPAQAQRLRRGTVARLLRTHRIRRVTADEVWQVWRAPAVRVAEGAAAATAAHLALLLPRVQLVHAQRQQCTKALEAVLAQLAARQEAEPPADPGAGPASPASPGPSDVAIVRSLPGAGVRVVTSVFAYAAEAIRTCSGSALRAVTGIAPVTRRTGKRSGKPQPPKPREVSMRRACNAHLRNAFYHFARVSVSVDSAADALYAAHRAKGHTHGRALRSVADRWLRILMGMLTTRTLYDPTRFAEPAGGVPAARA